MTQALPTRDSVTTIRADGSRAFLYPADVRGRFARFRRISAAVLIFIYLALPWIPVGGFPAVFLDIGERRFHFFGLIFAPQDTFMLFFLITGLGFLLFFVTALLGRIWCGWACPHTVFLDHVYRRIERVIEGDANRRRALAAAPMSAGKAARLFSKHGLYILVSAFIAHLFLAYFVSLPEVWLMVSEAPTEHWGAFLFMAVATGVLYFNFAWFREQLCIVICPYGRLQSILTDDHSLVVGYDTQRGEPRGRLLSRMPGEGTETKAAAGGAAALGDCVDCHRCVQVCPTGIDIRQGLQMECIGCTACIDACDEVMKRVGRPTGLIRYDSQNGFARQLTRWFRPRTAVYGFLLLLGISVATWAASGLHGLVLGVTRIPGAPYIVDGGYVRNQYLVRAVNKRAHPVVLRIRIDDAPSGIIGVGLDEPFVLPSLGEQVRPVALRQPVGEYNGQFHFNMELIEEGGVELSREIEFLGPDASMLPSSGKESR